MTELNLKKSVSDQIANNAARIAEIGVDYETAMKVQAARPDFSDFAQWHAYFEANSIELEAADLFQTNKMLEETLDKPLVKATKRYVITDGHLTSPSGFHPDSLVFIKNDVWIETDRLPRTVANVRVYDMKTICEEMEISWAKQRAGA